MHFKLTPSSNRNAIFNYPKI